MNSSVAQLERVSPRKLEKMKIVEELKQLLRSYAVVGICDLTGIRAKQLQEMRKAFRGQVVLKVAKNTLMKRAVDACKNEKPGLEKLEKHLTGSNIFVFANINPFKLQMLFDKNKVESAAAPGDIAQGDIVIPAGNTGIPPGPILSKFSQLKIPTKIQEGSIFVMKDTVVAREGDVISADLADILSRLGIKPIKVGLTLKVAYDDGVVIPGEQLKLDLDAYRSDLTAAVQNALNLAVNAPLFVPEAMPYLLQKAVISARNLAANACLLLPETIDSVLALAQAKALALSSILASRCPELGLAAPTASPTQPPAEKKPEAKEKPEEKEEEGEGEGESVEGLAALFG